MVNLRAAIVGCGRIASSDHALAYAADGRVNLVAVVDPDRNRARAMARRFGVREVFTSLEEMLATTDVDLITLCASPHPHAASAITALRAGCHVLCERPATMTAAETARVAAVAAAEHRVLTFGCPYRHLTEARIARGIADAGEIGEIHDVQLTVVSHRDAGDRHGHPDRVHADGGPISGVGIQLLDLAMWLTRFPEAMDTFYATHERTGLVRFCDGMSLTIDTSYATHPADEDAVRVRLLGDRGDLELFPLLLSHPNGPAATHFRPALPGKPRDHQLAHRRQNAAFVDTCLGRGPVPVTPAEAIHVQEIADRLHRSANPAREATRA